MPLTRPVVVVLVFVVTLSSRIFAQSDSTHPLLRMERSQLGELSCVLVADDGNYRLEKEFRAKSEMYLGSLDAMHLEQLRAMIVNESLRRMSQADIRTPLISDTFDHLQLAIWRQDVWQQLTFISPASRKPFKQSLEPLLEWFQALQKTHPAAIRLKGNITRCMPPPIMRATNESGSESAETARASRASDLLFRISTEDFHGWHVETNCTIVFADGSYERQHTDQSDTETRKDRVASGRLDSEAIKQLKSILVADELRNSSGDPAIGESRRPARDGSITVLRVPRESGVQSLRFSTTFNTMASPKEIGGMSNMTYHVPDKHVLEPLKGWMKHYTDHNGTEQSGAIWTGCSPRQ